MDGSHIAQGWGHMRHVQVIVIYSIDVTNARSHLSGGLRAHYSSWLLEDNLPRFFSRRQMLESAGILCASAHFAVCSYSQWMGMKHALHHQLLHKQFMWTEIDGTGTWGLLLSSVMFKPLPGKWSSTECWQNMRKMRRMRNYEQVS